MFGKHPYRVLKARREHLKALPAIERAAATSFPKEILSQELRNQATPLSSFEDAHQRGLLWVAITAEDNPVGFALTEEHHKVLHLAEMDVYPEHQNQGIGKALLDAVSKFAKSAGYQGITLTTFSSIPWNAPWYKRMGFCTLTPGELSPELRDILKDEAQHGLDSSLRVAMLKNL